MRLVSAYGESREPDRRREEGVEDEGEGSGEMGLSVYWLSAARTRPVGESQFVERGV